VAEMNKYIKEEHESKIRMNREMKKEISNLTQSLASQKEELTRNLAQQSK
jgi:hypothetical protein